jgi:hypothetical protein
VLLEAFDPPSCRPAKIAFAAEERVVVHVFLAALEELLGVVEVPKRVSRQARIGIEGFAVRADAEAQVEVLKGLPQVPAGLPLAAYRAGGGLKLEGSEWLELRRTSVWLVDDVTLPSRVD